MKVVLFCGGLGTRLREHAPFFGNMVWVLMMLGIWLESRDL